MDGRRVVSGILHMLRTGEYWRDVPVRTTVHNRFTDGHGTGWIVQIAAIDKYLHQGAPLQPRRQKGGILLPDPLVSLLVL